MLSNKNRVIFPELLDKLPVVEVVVFASPTKETVWKPIDILKLFLFESNNTSEYSGIW